MILICSICGKTYEKSTGHYNRAMKLGLKVYCNRTCAGIGRRTTKEQKKALKSEYDKKRRNELADVLKKQKAEYYQRTKNPEKERLYRKSRMHKHIEYCRRPEYKAKKKQYDEHFRAKKEYGELWQAALVLKDLENQLDSKEIKLENGQTNKSQKRKRLWRKMQKA